LHQHLVQAPAIWSTHTTNETGSADLTTPLYRQTSQRSSWLKAAIFAECSISRRESLNLQASTLETAFKTHARKAVQAGASSDEMEHVVIQLLPIA